MITGDTIEDIIKQAESDETAGQQLPNVDGYSSRKVRFLLNCLGGLSTRYLEIGIHVGSTFIPAMYGNMHLHGTAIDNWSLFGNCRPKFEQNLKQHLPNQLGNIEIIENDCFKVNPNLLYPIDLYFYDGDHKRDPQYLAFTHFAPALSNRFVALIDDFNWAEPREETYRAIKDLGWKIEWEKFLHGPYNGGANEWWNGVWVGIVVK